MEEVRGGVEEVVHREEDGVMGVVVLEEKERKATVVEELKEELQRFHQRKEEQRRRAEFDAVKREMERLQEREKEQKVRTPSTELKEGEFYCFVVLCLALQSSHSTTRDGVVVLWCILTMATHLLSVQASQHQKLSQEEK